MFNYRFYCVIKNIILSSLIIKIYIFTEVLCLKRLKNIIFAKQINSYLIKSNINRYEATYFGFPICFARGLTGVGHLQCELRQNHGYAFGTNDGRCGQEFVSTSSRGMYL